MFVLKDDPLEERSTVVLDQPWKDQVFIPPTRAAGLPDGVFKTVDELVGRPPLRLPNAPGHLNRR